MKYLTAIEASKRIGVAERTVRMWVQSGKLSAHHPAANRLAIPETEVENLARERRQYKPEVTGNTDVSAILAKMAELEQRVMMLEAEREKYQRVQINENTPISTLEGDYTYPTYTRPKTAKNRVSSQSPVNSDLPDGAMLLVDFAARYVYAGFRQENGNTDKLEVESRPRPGRPGQTTYYLLPEQQARALEYWQRHGIEYHMPVTGKLDEDNEEVEQ